MNEGLTETEISLLFEGHLISVFSLAEQHIISCLDEPNDTDLVLRISEDRAMHCVVFTMAITSSSDYIEYTKISTCLAAGLLQFYSDVSLYLPEEVIKRSFEQNPIVFPATADIDWEELLNRSLILRGLVLHTYTGLIPEHILESLLDQEFYNVSRFMALAETPFDQQIFDDGADRLTDRISGVATALFEDYWEQFDRPPYQPKVVKIRERIAAYRFDLEKFQFMGLPSSIPELYRKIIPEEDMLRNLSNFLKLHELKEQHLIAQLNREAAEQETTPSNIPPPPLPAMAPKLTVQGFKQDGIYQALEPYVVSGSDTLKKLLAAKTAEGLVVIGGRPANAVAYVFRQAVEAENIANTKSEI